MAPGPGRPGPAPVLVTGGTGTLGRLVVPRLRAAGCRVRVLSRHPHAGQEAIEYVTGDLSTGAGVEAAVDGMATIVHCASGYRGDPEAAGTLVRAARAGAGVGTGVHLVFVSIVGVDRLPVRGPLDRGMFGYLERKLAAEQVIARSGLPWTTMRATQFHDLVLMVAKRLGGLPVVPVPAELRLQPVDPDEVAGQLVELALGEPAGLVPDLAGPRAYTVAELIRSYLRACHRYRPMLPVWLPGAAARAARAGALLPIGGSARGPAPGGTAGRSWEEFLADQIKAERAGTGGVEADRVASRR
ncbi:MAG: NAD(P)H-binding protein [Micromonosporaceae bacterium]|nr:NAD(P)H-binding protein [Micromonosporaceae bacterium]